MSYQPRYIQFKELITLGKWQLKVYFISKEANFNFQPFYDNVKQRLPDWLISDNQFNAKHYHTGFLILHAASEGVFSILNWWLDGYMINSTIFLSDYNNSTHIKKISGNGLGPCVWELEVINFERITWTEDVLKSNNSKAYLEKTFNAFL